MQKAANDKFDGTLLNGLVNLWQFDGNANDSVGSAHLTTNGNVAYVKGNMKQCAEFNGGGYFSKTATGINLSAGNWTLSFWVNPMSGNTLTNGIIMNRANAMQHWGSYISNSVILWFDNGANTATNAISNLKFNTWYHMCVKNGKLFENGVSKNFTYARGTLNFSNILIGLYSTDFPDCLFLGRIEQVAIWNRVIDDDEAVRLYNGGKGLIYQ